MEAGTNSAFEVMEGDKERQNLVTSSCVTRRTRVTSVTRSQYHDDLKSDLQTVRSGERDTYVYSWKVKVKRGMLLLL